MILNSLDDPDVSNGCWSGARALMVDVVCTDEIYPRRRSPPRRRFFTGAVKRRPERQRTALQRLGIATHRHRPARTSMAAQPPHHHRRIRLYRCYAWRPLRSDRGNVVTSPAYYRA
jgi:hypothetical protein